MSPFGTGEAAAPVLRAGRDEDAAGFIALIGACWAEYPGCVMDLDGEVPELRALASHYAAKGGRLWAAERDGVILGMAAAAPLPKSPGGEDGAWEICKVYVAAAVRGTGLAHRLLDAAEAHAGASGARRLVLWSDTRFERAHRFYEKRSYVRAGAIRPLNDLSNSLEFRYAKPLGTVAVETLDAAGAASAEPALAGILVECVDAGASVSFLPPLAADAARRFWRGVSRDVAQGTRLLLAAWSDGVLAGTVTLDLGMPPNQPHRAEVQKLLVRPGFRRRGIAHALMQRAEEAAAASGRTLLTLDTASGSAAEPLYRGLGWHEAGRIPGFALDAGRVPCATVIFWKRPGPAPGDSMGEPKGI